MTLTFDVLLSKNLDEGGGGRDWGRFTVGETVEGYAMLNVCTVQTSNEISLGSV